MPLSDWQGYASWQLNSAITGGGISQITDPLGRTVHYSYEPPTGGYAASRLHRVTNPANGVTTYGYAGPYNIGSITDARGITYLTNTYCTSGGGIVCPPDPVSRPAVRRAVVRRFRDRFPAQSCLSAAS